MTADRHPDLDVFDAAVAEHEARADAEAAPRVSGVAWADAYIEANAAACDAIVPGLGDVLRDVWADTVRPAWFTHALCDCDRTAPYHRWNCPATPLWAQTIRDLDPNSWTFLEGRV